MRSARHRCLLIADVLASLLVPVFYAYASADVVINEVQSSNNGALLDEDGGASDWIELLNRGDQEVNLAGWGLSDRVGNPMKWTFPACTLGSGVRRIVFASGKDRTNVLETALLESPHEIPGLVLWLRTDDLACANGEKITAWTDLSAYGNHAFSTNNMSCPTLRTNAVNGHSAVHFTRSSAQSLLLPVTNFNGLATLRDVSIFVVCRWSGGQGVLGAWDATSGNTHFEIRDAGKIRLRIGALDSEAASTRSTTGVTANAWCQLSAFMNGSGDTPVLTLHRDGADYLMYAKDPGASALSSYSYMALGNSLKAERFFDGDMAEVLFFNRSLPVMERTAVERYLAARYGLPFQGGAAKSELHANFSLAADGESVVLTSPGGALADSVAVPAVPSGASYGRSPDSTGAFAFFADPTPGAANTATAYGAPVSMPMFSRARGVCDEPFELALNHSDPDAVIYYTLDGSMPAPTNGWLYAAPVTVSNTTVVRAVAHKEGALPIRAVATHTYLFLSDVAAQTNRPAGYPADWNGFTYTSYGLSTDLAAQPGHAEALQTALRAIPVLALSASVDDLFGVAGVYANPTVDGLEREVSVEWLTHGVGQLQLDAGLRVQGGASRVFSNSPKKSLRLLFKDAYGTSRLKAPVLAAGGTTLADFNTLILRAEYNNAWTHNDGTQRPRGTNMRDQWVRNTQLAMSGSGAHGSHVHLFLNGLYWGLYNVSERPDAAFAANTFGGEREEYDAMTPDGVRDGDNVAWNAMFAIAKAGLAARVQYEALERYLNMDHLIDYMILNFYGGNADWPHHNWSAVRRREEGAGYFFHCWDSERTLEAVDYNCTAVTYSTGPAYLHTALCANAEYRLRFADRVQRSLFCGGALTPSNAAARFAALAAQVEPAVYGEAARWGAYRREVTPGGTIPRYGTNTWCAERDRLLTEWFPARTTVVVGQFRAASLYPSVDAPVFSRLGGAVESGEEVSATSAQGIVYLTFNGCDPRVAYTGEVASNAVACTVSFAITNAGVVKARALSGGVWSALAEIAFTLIVSEPVFLPAGDGDWNAATNWWGTEVPNACGRRVRIPAAAADRTIDIRDPVTVGQITFDLADSAFCSRIREKEGRSTLTFNGGTSGVARIRVTGSGAGYAEFDIEAGVTVQADLEMDVAHPAGHPIYGALRLRETWAGSGGLRKCGVGMASFTGDGKRFTGAVAVEEGVLSFTAPAALTQAAGLSVEPGGQIRLTSGGSGGLAREYMFGGTLVLSGFGRGAALPDGAGLGKSGALRYEPGGGDNQAVVATPVELLGEVGVHVEGGGAGLSLAGPVRGGSRLVKSGAGLLTLPPGVTLTAAVEVANGTLAFVGAAALGPVSGMGTVRVEGGCVIAVPSVEGVVLETVLQQAGEGALVNGVIRASLAVGALGGVRIYLPAQGDRFRGVLFAPLASELAAAVRRTPSDVYVSDAGGLHLYAGQRWRLDPDAQVVTVPARVDFGDGEVEGRVVEVRRAAAPASYGAWRAWAFTNASERADESISGPLAALAGDRLSNLARYAFGMGRETPAATRSPHLTLTGSGVEVRFSFDPGRDDVAYVVEASTDLLDWGISQRLFDSRLNYPENLDAGWLTLRDAAVLPSRFYRLRLVFDGQDPAE